MAHGGPRGRTLRERGLREVANETEVHEYRIIGSITEHDVFRLYVTMNEFSVVEASLWLRTAPNRFF